MVVFAVAPAEVMISSSDNGQDSQVVNVPAGVTKLSHPVDPNGSMKARMERVGVIVAECTPERDGFRFQAHPKTYNFNVYCAMSESSTG